MHRKPGRTGILAERELAQLLLTYAAEVLKVEMTPTVSRFLCKIQH